MSAADGGGNPLLSYGVALVLFALGLMSKPMLVTLPFVLLLMDYWPLCRYRAGDKPSAALRLLMEKIPFFVLSVASSIITFLVQRKGGAVSSSLPLGDRIANALISYVRYITKAFWPHELSVLYPHPGHWPSWQVIASAVLLIAISALVILSGRKRPFLFVGWFLFVGCLVPVVGLVQVGIQSMADRYMYVPMIGLSIAVVWGANETLPFWEGRTKAFSCASGAFLVCCAFLTARQVQFWKTSEALFLHAVEVTEKNYLAYNNLGFYLSGQGKTEAAIEHYRKSLEINPLYEDALNNMGYALAGQKKYLEAIPYYEAALRSQPNHAEVHNNYGNALSEIGRIDEAVQHYRIVLEQKPEHADAHNNLGIALAMQGKLDDAMSHFRNAIRFKPRYASAHSNLGNALAVQHRLDEAIKEYNECLKLKSDDPQAHNNLGNVLVEQGRLDEGIAHYKEALRLNADNPEAHNNLGAVLLRHGKREEAAAHFSEALRLKPDYAEARRQLEMLRSLQPGTSR